MRAAILGCSVSGISASKLLLQQGFEVIGYDKNFRVCDSLDFTVYPDNEGCWQDVELLIVSPGVFPNHLLIKKALEKGVEVIGEIEFGLRHLKNPCIAITGTNGKSTTSLLVTHILNESGHKAICLGNIGMPLTEEVLALEENTIVVLELSSYQIEQIESVKIDRGAILNLSEDHLDRYGSLDEYAKAKAKLLEKVKRKVFIHKSILKTFPFLSHSNADFFDEKQSVAILKELGYTIHEGKSVENLLFAWYLVKDFVSNKAFVQAVKSFKGLEHRLEMIGQINGAFVYNDSKGTNPDAVLYALKKVSGQIVLLLGGEDKGLCFKKILEEEDKISQLICFGKARDKIAKELFALQPKVFFTMKEGVEFAFSQVGKSKSILFSPGCASFDAFKNYQERGSFFKKVFREYKRENNL